MTTEERMVRAATRRLEPELRFPSENRRSYTAIRVFLTLCIVLAIAATAAAHSAHVLPVPATYVSAVVLFIAIAIIWSHS